MSTMMDACKTVVRHYKEGNLNWPMIIYISLAHVAAVIGLFSILECKTYTLLWAFILWPISGIGITGGVHRLWAHRSYKATYPLRVYLMLANSIANQGSIWHWSRDHRVHHKHSEVLICLSFYKFLVTFRYRHMLILTTRHVECSSLIWAGFL
jgi:stearoyl-CoA desaturase (delta-9 desaturase)